MPPRPPTTPAEGEGYTLADGRRGLFQVSASVNAYYFRGGNSCFAANYVERFSV